MCSATVKDLGVLISTNLKRSFHISQIVSSAFTCSYILKSLSSKNLWTLLKPYITYVHPKLEFNTLVYSLLI